MRLSAPDLGAESCGALKTAELAGRVFLPLSGWPLSGWPISGWVVSPVGKRSPVVLRETGNLTH